jgi:hypothetical protein
MNQATRDDNYFARLGNFWGRDWNHWIWLLFSLPALYFFQTTVHEGTHAMAALVTTGSFPKLAPFPHQTQSGNFLNGVTLGDPSTTVTKVIRTQCNSSARTATRTLGGFIAMPQFVALGLIILFSTLFFLVPVPNPYVRFALRAWYLGACIDFMYGTIRGLIGGCNPTADWSRFMLRADIAPGLFALMTWILWLGVLSHFLWVYWSAWGKNAVAETGFWDYRWIAMTLGVLSFIAVLLSLAVSDPAIVKKSAAFIVLLIVQIGALIWYWVYFGLTFKFKS